jgi:hypothetical protein
MCDTCQQIESKIARLRRIADPALDALTLQRLKEALAAAEEERVAIKCEEARK